MLFRAGFLAAGLMLAGAVATLPGDRQEHYPLPPSRDMGAETGPRVVRPVVIGNHAYMVHFGADGRPDAFHVRGFGRRPSGIVPGSPYFNDLLAAYYNLPHSGKQEPPK